MSDFLNQCYAQMHKGDIIVAYKGTISADIIADTLGLVESKLDDLLEQNLVRKKLYNVLVECLQNLYHHVDPVKNSESTHNFGAFVLSKTDNGYRISTGNMVRSEKSIVLKEKIDKINSLSKEELKDFYKFVLNNQTFSEKGGGGLGLIDMARKTGNKLEYKFSSYSSEYDFFNLNVLITE
ncbi:MAG: hypothetical protein H6536_03220 [Bacteroidales bacterium]|nr:hypothetical protein [Bacteroidales bacterium]